MKLREAVIFSYSGETSKGFLSSEVLTTNEPRPLEVVFSLESVLK